LPRSSRSLSAIQRVRPIVKCDADGGVVSR
jgi:hypothetical protein